LDELKKRKEKEKKRKKEGKENSKVREARTGEWIHIA